MLYRRVGEIFLESEPARARAAFSGSLRRFLVEDRFANLNELRVVLLVESPHTYEVKLSRIRNRRYPLAGPTGRYVRNKLMAWKRALNLPRQRIGRIVYEGNTVQQLGIMNVSQLPFQCGAYKYSCIPQRNNDCRAYTDYWNDYITCMEYIRKHPGVKSYMAKGNNRTQRTQRLQRLRCKIDRLEYEIIEDLAGRLASIGENVQVMCLGNVAQIFYLKSFYFRNTNINGRILDLPHPSNSGWRNIDPASRQGLQGILDHIQPLQAT